MTTVNEMFNYILENFNELLRLDTSKVAPETERVINKLIYDIKLLMVNMDSKYTEIYEICKTMEHVFHVWDYWRQVPISKVIYGYVPGFKWIKNRGFRRA